MCLTHIVQAHRYAHHEAFTDTPRRRQKQAQTSWETMYFGANINRARVGVDCVSTMTPTPLCLHLPSPFFLSFGHLILHSSNTLVKKKESMVYCACACCSANTQSRVSSVLFLRIMRLSRSANGLQRGCSFFCNGLPFQETLDSDTHCACAWSMLSSVNLSNDDPHDLSSCPG